jgi:hypothetical protein
MSRLSRLPNLLLAFVLFWSTSAAGATRFALTCSEPTVLVYVDATPLDASMGGGQMKTVLAPGVHIVQVLDPGQTIIYSGQLDLPDGLDVKATWDRTNGLRLVSPAGLAEPKRTDAHQQTTVAMDPVEAENVALTEAQDNRKVNQSSGSEDHLAGGGENLGPIARTGAQLVGQATGVSSYTGGSAGIGSGQGTIRQQVTYSAAQGTVKMVRNSCAGGMGFSTVTSTDARQGRPTPVSAITGTVNFVYTGKDGMQVFVDDFLSADFSKGAGAVKVKLEEGYHDVVIRRTSDFAVVGQGKVKVEKDYTLELGFSTTQAITAKDRVWLWSPR